MPKPLLVGRNNAKLESISRDYGHLSWSTDLDAVLSDPEYSIYFDAQTTDRRAEAVPKSCGGGQTYLLRKADRGYHSMRIAYELYQLAVKSGVKHGVVQDKLWLPGMLKLKTLRELGFFRKIRFGARRIRLLGI